MYGCVGVGGVGGTLKVGADRRSHPRTTARWRHDLFPPDPETHFLTIFGTLLKVLCKLAEMDEQRVVKA